MSKHIVCATPLPDERMVAFIKEHHVMTLATTGVEQHPWCASCFYVYLPDSNRFVFTTDDETRHGREMHLNPTVAACIALQTHITGKIRGVQITGQAGKVTGKEYFRASLAFLRRFPIAALKKTTLWYLEPDHIKMTDNRLGFGVKLLWDKPGNR
jgi:uncharacterized protein